MLIALAVPACRSPADWAELSRENDDLRRGTRRLEHTIAECDATVAALRGQIDNLRTWSSDRPADLFAPTRIEIASLSGGADYDDKPGDDGITVYIRPRDADNDVVKVPGRLEIQLLDNANLQSPRVLGVYVFEADKLRNLWHGRFMTNHYTLKCPFSPGGELPKTRKLLISAKFSDFLTGAVLTATKEVAFRRATP